MSTEKKALYFWKGKRVSEKVHNARLKIQASARNLRNVYGIRNHQHSILNLQEEEEDFNGRRLVNLMHFGNEMICEKCNAVLSVLDRKLEKKFALASVFHIKCRNCSFIQIVTTDKIHDVPQEKNNSIKSTHFDVNSKAVIGSLHAGLGCTHINKLLSAMNVPAFSSQSFSLHEKEVGKAAEEMAIISCKKATIEEKKLCIKNIDELKSLLPENLDMYFLLPGSNLLPPSERVPPQLSLQCIIRFAASYDMAWITRGTGRDYDSLTGYATLQGYFTKKVLSYICLNRKCRLCDLGHAPSDHDCRKSFAGSAKAMEPYAAVQLAKDNNILSENGMELGILIADNDSCTIAALRNALEHDVVKHSDKNHTSKGVVNELFKIKKENPQCKELTNDAIQYLKKCFNYCLSQNKGKIPEMKKAIQNIVEHSFNKHSGCSIKWCGFLKNPKTYKHSVIKDGFKDVILYDKLKNLFGKLADKAHSFAAGTSSNGNESFNAQYVSRAPKSRFYGSSTSADFRLAFTVNEKNQGGEYISDLNTKLLMSPGKHTAKRNAIVTRKADRRYKKSLTREFKAKRLINKKKKRNLRFANESIEGTTYESDIGLLGNIDIPIDISEPDLSQPPIIVFFDLETSGMSNSAIILQIGAKSGNESISLYIKPTKRIDAKASACNRILYENGVLTHHGVTIEQQNIYCLLNAMQLFYNFLCKFKRIIVLAAHNCQFDRPKFIQAAVKTSMLDRYGTIIHGFCDTLQLTKKYTGKRKKGDNVLENLASDYGYNTSNSHNALDDVKMLDHVMVKLGIKENEMIDSCITWNNAVELVNLQESSSQSIKDLQLSNLKSCSTLAMRKKMGAANISYQMIKDAYQKNKLKGIIELLGADDSGIVRVTKCINVAIKISKYFDEL